MTCQNDKKNFLITEISLLANNIFTRSSDNSYEFKVMKSSV